VTTVPKTDTGSLVENTKALSEKFLKNSANTPHKLGEKWDLLDTKFFYFDNFVILIEGHKIGSPNCLLKSASW